MVAEAVAQMRFAGELRASEVCELQTMYGTVVSRFHKKISYGFLSSQGWCIIRDSVNIECLEKHHKAMDCTP